MKPEIMPGVPEDVAAGDGWHTYLVSVPNDTSTALEDIDVMLGREASAVYSTVDIPDDYSSYVHLQAKDRASGKWQDVLFPDFEDYLYAKTDLAPYTSLQIQVRFRVDEDFPVHPQADHSIGSVVLEIKSYRVDPAEDGACIRGLDSEAVKVHEPGWTPGNATGSPTPSALLPSRPAAPRCTPYDVGGSPVGDQLPPGAPDGARGGTSQG